MAPVIALSFSLLCFAPLTQSAIETEKPVAYVNFSFPSRVEAAVDRNFHVVSVRESDGRKTGIGTGSRYAYNLSFGQFTEALISRINSRSEFRKNHLLLFSAAFTRRITGKERNALNDRLVQTFVSQTLKYIPGARFHTVKESLPGRTGIPETQAFAAMKKHLDPREDFQQTVISVKGMKALSVSGVGKVMPSFGTPLQKLIEKIKDPGAAQHHIQFHDVSDPIHAVHGLFQNPFSKIKQNNRDTLPSSYLFPDRRTRAAGNNWLLRRA